MSTEYPFVQSLDLSEWVCKSYLEIIYKTISTQSAQLSKNRFWHRPAFLNTLALSFAENMLPTGKFELEHFWCCNEGNEEQSVQSACTKLRRKHLVGSTEHSIKDWSWWKDRCLNTWMMWHLWEQIDWQQIEWIAVCQTKTWCGWGSSSGECIYHNKVTCHSWESYGESLSMYPGSISDY
jgi:hypothetical protein